MIKLFPFGLVINLIIFSFLSCAPSKEVARKTLGTPKATFPMSWSGIWEGDLAIFSKGKKTRTLPMKLTILPQGDSVEWTIQYDTMDTRPYTLKTINAEDGVYLVDEHNTIALETYLFGQKLISQYDVGGNQLTITEEKIGDKIIFEVIMSKDKPISITGGTTHKGEEIPEVKTFPVLIYQKAVLSKKG